MALQIKVLFPAADPGREGHIRKAGHSRKQQASAGTEMIPEGKVRDAQDMERDILQEDEQQDNKNRTDGRGISGSESFSRWRTTYQCL